MTTTTDVPGYTLDDLYAMRGRMARIHNLNEQETAMSPKTPHLITYTLRPGSPIRTMVGVRGDTCWRGIDTDSGETIVLDAFPYTAGHAHAIAREPLSTDVDRNRLATLEQLTEGAILIEDTEWAKDRFAADRAEQFHPRAAAALRQRARINERNHEVKAKQEKAAERLESARERLGKILRHHVVGITSPRDVEQCAARIIDEHPDVVDAILGKADDQ
ncbi:hypothetical protein [Gordonia sp. MMO-8]|uniref:hypothetical protein n=1 Tax=Gordonia sp. MMO-8 TaxID=3127886 RepID=UPI0030199D48